MNIEDIENIKKNILTNIKLIRGKKADSFEKNWARDCIAEKVDSLTRKYVYRLALSEKDELARLIYKVMYEVEQELHLYLDTKQGNKDTKIQEIHRKITLFL